MNSSGHSRRTSLYVGGAAVLLAAAVWGTYAWKFAARGPAGDLPAVADASQESSEASPEHPAGTPAGDGGKPDDTRERVSPGAETQDTFAASVRANAPPSREAGVQITLSEKKSAAPSALANRLEMGRSALARGEYVTAREILSGLLGQGLAAADEAAVRQELGQLADAMLFSRATNTGDPLTGSQTVGSGDTLHGIARRQKISEELLAAINQVSDPTKLFVGRRLKTLRGPFHAVINKSQHRMDVLLGDAYVKSFPVGLGTNGGTPTGTWIVNSKLANPDWTDPTNGRHYLADDPENPIGERWIGLYGVEGEAVGKTGFGIHGTIDPASIGQNMSMGCIRLSAKDVEQVYDLLVLNESRVVVRP